MAAKPRVLTDDGADVVPTPRVIGSTIAEDRLVGVREIAEFLYGSGDKPTQKRVYRLIEHRLIPCGRWGGQYIASKRKLLAHNDTLTSGPITEPQE